MRCRSMRASTAASRLSGVARKSMKYDNIVVEYSAVWKSPGMMLCS